MQCTYPTTPRTPSHKNKEGRLGTRQNFANLYEVSSATEGKTLKHTTMKLSSLFTSKISFKEVLKETWKHTSLNFTKGKRVYILDADTQTRRA